jgi:hypothetical protein
MATDKLLELLQFETDELFAGFKKASVEGKGTPQEVADFREGYFNKFLRKYFPFPHRIAKGIVSDTAGNRSASVDSIIINPIHPYTIDVAEKFSIILADGVDVAIELKPDISDKGELETALKQVQSVKKLRRVNGPLLLKSGHTAEEIDYSKQIPSFIFAFKAKADIKDTVQEIIDYYNTNSIPKIEQLDYAVILGRGIIFNHKFKEKSELKNGAGEKVTGFSYHQLDNDTLAMFLFFLNKVYHATATFHGQILPLYIQGINHKNVLAFSD